MLCHKCGAQIAEGSAFCQKCGAKAIIDESDIQPVAASTSTSQTQQPRNAPMNVSRKKKSKRLVIILIVIGLIIAAVLIAANVDELAERGKQAREDDAYIKSHQTNASGETRSAFDAPVLLI